MSVAKAGQTEDEGGGREYVWNGKGMLLNGSKDEDLYVVRNMKAMEENRETEETSETMWEKADLCEKLSASYVNSTSKPVCQQDCEQENGKQACNEEITIVYEEGCEKLWSKQAWLFMKSPWGRRQ